MAGVWRLAQRQLLSWVLRWMLGWMLRQMFAWLDFRPINFMISLLMTMEIEDYLVSVLRLHHSWSPWSVHCIHDHIMSALKPVASPSLNWCTLVRANLILSKRSPVFSPTFACVYAHLLGSKFYAIVHFCANELLV